jgi:hypothetical protein
MASPSEPIQTEPLPNSTQAPVSNTGTVDATNENRPKKKQKKLKSPAWEFFHRITKKFVVDGKEVEDVTGVCKYCFQKFNANSGDGTTRLWNYIKQIMILVRGKRG